MENKRLLIAVIILVVNVTVFLASSPRTSVELDFNGFESALMRLVSKTVAWSLIYVVSAVIQSLVVYILLHSQIIVFLNRLLVFTYIYIVSTSISPRIYMALAWLELTSWIIMLVVSSISRISKRNSGVYIDVSRFIENILLRKEPVKPSVLVVILASHAFSISLLLLLVLWINEFTIRELVVSLHQYIIILATAIGTLILVVFHASNTYQESLIKGFLSGWGLMGIIPLLIYTACNLKVENHYYLLFERSIKNR